MVDKINARIARVVQGGERRREGCTFGEFRKQNPPSFDREPDPMAEENWLLKIEKLLRALECIDAQKVMYATFALWGSADRWWLSTEQLLKMELGRDTPINWEKFKEVFNGTYFPNVVRDRKAREFSDLVQGAMTVEEYAAKFVELSHFAPYLILDEPNKVKKFREGLDGRIRPLIIASRVDTFTIAVKRVMSLKEDSKYKPGSNENGKRQGLHGSNHGEGRGQNFKKGSFKKFSNGNHSNGQDKGTPLQSSDKKPCPNCSKYHEGQTRDGVRIFYTCKQPGHFARESPNAKGLGSSSLPQIAKGNNDAKRVQGRVYALIA